MSRRRSSMASSPKKGAGKTLPPLLGNNSANRQNGMNTTTTNLYDEEEELRPRKRLKGKPWTDDEIAHLLFYLYSGNDQNTAVHLYQQMYGKERTKQRLKLKYLELKNGLKTVVSKFEEDFISHSQEDAYSFMCPAQVVFKKKIIYGYHTKHFKDIKLACKNRTIRFTLQKLVYLTSEKNENPTISDHKVAIIYFNIPPNYEVVSEYKTKQWVGVRVREKAPSAVPTDGFQDLPADSDEESDDEVSEESSHLDKQDNEKESGSQNNGKT
eukprot:TRINITY_DN534_c0_g1_i7.p1 TRINITY_DN534_c0_g1~~TRINITY_DN534_c0_g1_i7.p1  ORF type:complete len:269 (+),score=41.84 TRINITY_DN534_c0_g1_i7:100-906(+)